jgi:hypothetical protein
MSHFSSIEFKISSRYKNAVIAVLKDLFGGDIQVYDQPKKLESNYGKYYANQDSATPVDVFVPVEILNAVFPGAKRINGLGFSFSGEFMEIVGDEYEIASRLPKIKTAISQAVVKVVALQNGFNLTNQTVNKDGSITMNLKKKQIQTVL